MSERTRGDGDAMTSSRTTMDLVGDREIVITRTFAAPAAIVFDAFTKPELVRRWWAPASRGVTLEVCDADVRPGGAYRYVLARGETERYAFSGTYLEVERPTRLVYTQRLEPHPGDVHVTVSFTEKGGATAFVSREVWPSRDVREMALRTGMEAGMRETMDLLDELVVSLA